MRVLEELGDKREAVAARLERAREILGIASKREFAEMAGIKEQTYGPVTKCSRDLSLDAAKKFRKRYGLSLEFIYFGKTDELPFKIAREL